MTIHPRPDQEIKIQEALREGLIQSAEDLIDAWLERLRQRPPSRPSPPETLKEVFDAVRGLAEELDFSRNRSTGRRVDVA
ncbi:MAG: hypothetical protein ACLPND_23480 [Candidatus Korobacteraceae bacterium]|jgi:hypothetical protein